MAPHRRLPPSAWLALPAIEVVEPDTSGPLPSPVSVRLRFRPEPGAEIDPASFRVYYGWLGIDITARLLRHAELSAAGLALARAEIPSGRHKITLVIADTLGRIGRRTLLITVL